MLGAGSIDHRVLICYSTLFQSRQLFSHPAGTPGWTRPSNPSLWLLVRTASHPDGLQRYGLG